MLINLKIFILSFVIGMLFMHFNSGDAHEIVVYPTKDNKHLFQFRDKTNNCFHLQQKVVKCAKNDEVIPVQL